MTMTIAEYLVKDGWEEFNDSLSHKDKRSFYKRFDTPTRCCCNDKEGIQVLIGVWPPLIPRSTEAYELEVSGEMSDGTWIKLHEWCMPTNIKKGLEKIPQLLATWEFIANYKEKDHE